MCLVPPKSLNTPKQCHHLGTNCSSTLSCRGQFTVKLSQYHNTSTVTTPYIYFLLFENLFSIRFFSVLIVSYTVTKKYDHICSPFLSPPSVPAICPLPTFMSLPPLFFFFFLTRWVCQCCLYVHGCADIQWSTGHVRIRTPSKDSFSLGHLSTVNSSSVRSRVWRTPAPSVPVFWLSWSCADN